MELHKLTPAEGSVKKGKRIARGQGSGRGGTSTVGHKGAKSRTGYSRKVGFEGGQMPIQRRLPKRGFKNHNRIEYKGINLDQLAALAAKNNWTSVTVDLLKEGGYMKNSYRIKVLARGEFSSKLYVQAHAFSASATKAIESAGGTVTII